MRIPLKYGHEEVALDLPSHKVAGILQPREISGIRDVETEVERALKNPIGSKSLREIVRSKKNPTCKVAVVIDDNTRPLPSRDILPPILQELFTAGIKRKNVTVIIATGLHRKLTSEEIAYLLGKLAEEIKVINHDPYIKENLAYLGQTSRGSNIYVNRTFADADIKILVGDVEYHQLFGYGGGAKSIHPGIADAESIRLVHSQLDSPQAEAGVIEGNPLQQEIREVGKMAKVNFIVNVVLNSKREVVRAFAGDIFEAFGKAVELVDKMWKINFSRKVDTVIVSCGGFPRDIDLYQSQKAIESARKVTKKGGKIILLAECQEGWGSRIFRKWMIQAKTPDVVIKEIKKKFIMGAHKAYLFAKEIQWAKIYLYSKMNPDETKKAFLFPITDLKKLDKIIEETNEVVVIPYGTTTLPWIK